MHFCVNQKEIDMKHELVLPGSTRQSFIDRWVNGWFSTHQIGPSYRVVIEGLESITQGWHRTIGSTPPAYLTSPGMASDLYKAACQYEGKSQIWLGVRMDQRKVA